MLNLQLSKRTAHKFPRFPNCRCCKTDGCWLDRRQAISHDVQPFSFTPSIWLCRRQSNSRSWTTTLSQSEWLQELCTCRSVSVHRPCFLSQLHKCFGRTDWITAGAQSGCRNPGGCKEKMGCSGHAVLSRMCCISFHLDRRSCLLTFMRHQQKYTWLCFCNVYFRFTCLDSDLSGVSAPLIPVCCVTAYLSLHLAVEFFPRGLSVRIPPSTSESVLPVRGRVSRHFSPCGRIPPKGKGADASLASLRAMMHHLQAAQKRSGSLPRVLLPLCRGWQVWRQWVSLSSRADGGHACDCILTGTWHIFFQRMKQTEHILDLDVFIYCFCWRPGQRAG